jgi:hypothetical protein
MKRLFSPIGILGALAVLAFTAGCGTNVVGPLSPPSAQAENFLTSAGFKARTPSTAKWVREINVTI